MIFLIDRIYKSFFILNYAFECHLVHYKSNYFRIRLVLDMREHILRLGHIIGHKSSGGKDAEEIRQTRN